MIIAFKTKITDKNTGKERVCKYSDVPTDREKWVYDLSYYPIPYDLMYLKVKGACRIRSGWWDGKNWKGLRMKDTDEIIAWKRNYELE